MYEILEGCRAHPMLPGPTPALLYCTCTPQNVGPESGRRVSHTTQYLRTHDTMVVKGWSVGSLLSESLGGSDAQLPMRTQWVPKGRWIIALFVGERFTRAALLA